MAQPTRVMTSEEANSIIDNALVSANTVSAYPTPENDEPVGIPPPPPTAQEPEQKLTPEQKKAAQEQEKIRKAQADLLGKEQADAIAEEQRKEEERQKTLLGIAEKVLDHGKSRASSAGNVIAAAPTPGDITFPLLLLILFFFILLQFNGLTRLQWIWFTLTGNAYVSPNAQSGNGGGPDTVPAVVPSDPAQVQETLIGVNLAAFSASGAYGGNPYS